MIAFQLIKSNNNFNLLHIIDYYNEIVRTFGTIFAVKYLEGGQEYRRKNELCNLNTNEFENEQTGAVSKRIKNKTAACVNSDRNVCQLCDSFITIRDSRRSEPFEKMRRNFNCHAGKTKINQFSCDRRKLKIREVKVPKRARQHTGWHMNDYVSGLQKQTSYLRNTANLRITIRNQLDSAARKLTDYYVMRSRRESGIEIPALFQ